jgi:TPR repeat protein
MEMFEMGQSFYDKGNYTEALKWYKKAADNGSSDAQSELGFMYMNGEGVPVNKSEGAKWLIKASENGDIMAQRALGFMYKNGDGVPQNISESNKWLGKASSQFYEAGKNNMKTNGQVALQFFSWVYEMGQLPYNVWSLFHIGEIYYYAEGGVHTDFQEAAKYFKAASDMGNQVAMYYMGICYETGNGVPKDSNMAKQYYSKSGYTSLPSRDF